MFQGDIDACCKETGCKNQAADLSLEAGTGPGIAVHDNSADVANRLAEAACRVSASDDLAAFDGGVVTYDQRNKVGPRPPGGADNDLTGQAQAK